MAVKFYKKIKKNCEDCQQEFEGTLAAKRCLKCRHDKSKKNARDRYKKIKKERLKQGICVYCALKPHIEGQIYCEFCASKANELVKNKNTEAKYNRKCRTCSSSIAFDDRWTSCERCRQRKADQREQKKQNRLSKNLCPRCGLHPTLKSMGASSSHCHVCHFKQTSSRYFGNCDKWEDLKSLYFKQKGKCPYTGLVIKLGDTAALDHIVPQARGGLNTIENFEWIHKSVNSFKGDMTREEFLTMVKLIYEFVNLHKN